MVHNFFLGLVMNRCIQKIAFEGIVSQSDAFFLLLVPFFMQNPMFNELTVQYSRYWDGAFQGVRLL